jgi:hypothetical protein
MVMAAQEISDRLEIEQLPIRYCGITEPPIR